MIAFHSSSKTRDAYVFPGSGGDATLVAVGFELWIDGELAWAQGRHEYQPMGSAVIARTDLFRDRDFRRLCSPPQAPGTAYFGLFASLGEVNAFLAKRRRRPISSHKCENKTHSSVSPSTGVT